MNQESARAAAQLLNHDAEHPVGSALEHVILASQRVITDRLDLLRLEVGESVNRGLRGAMLISAGALVSCCAWIALMGALLAMVTPYLSLPLGLLLIAILNAGLGSLLIAGGARDTRAVASPTVKVKRG